MDKHVHDTNIKTNAYRNMHICMAIYIYGIVLISNSFHISLFHMITHVIYGYLIYKHIL